MTAMDIEHLPEGWRWDRECGFLRNNNYDLIAEYTPGRGWYLFTPREVGWPEGKPWYYDTIKALVAACRVEGWYGLGPQPESSQTLQSREAAERALEATERVEAERPKPSLRRLRRVIRFLARML